MPAAVTLALETSSSHGSVAVVREGAVIFEHTFVSERSHNSQLFAPLGEALRVCGTSLERIVVGLGPGSYTGVRIGIAAAQGLAWCRNVPVFGLPSVVAPDAVSLPKAFVVCGDARRGAFFMAEVSEGHVERDIELLAGTELLSRREGDAGRPWFSFDPKVPMNVSAVNLAKPSASRLAQLASTYRDEDVFHLEERPLEPLYLAAPFITPPRR